MKHDDPHDAQKGPEWYEQRIYEPPQDEFEPSYDKKAALLLVVAFFTTICSVVSIVYWTSLIFGLLL